MNEHKQESSLPVLAESEAWAKLAKEAGIIPPQMPVVQAMVVVAAGREMGLPPLQSLRTMSFISGRLVMSVQLQLALARQKAGVVIERLEEGESSCTATLRRGDERVSCTYTMEDARRAGILRQGSSWEKYPRQMLRWRAIGDALRLIAPDVVMGLLDAEELAGSEFGAGSPPEPVSEPEPASEPEPDYPSSLIPAPQPSAEPPKTLRAEAGEHLLALGFSKKEMILLRDRWKAEGLNAWDFYEEAIASTSREDFLRVLESCDVSTDEEGW